MVEYLGKNWLVSKQLNLDGYSLMVRERFVHHLSTGMLLLQRKLP